MRTLVTFLKEAKRELEKVTWPNQKQLVRSTVTVVLATALMAIFLGGLDYGFGLALKSAILK
jgi:preprotein translocase subunit SecE